MDIDSIFHLLTWVVPGYCGIRMYWYATGPPRQRGSTETIMASLGWTVVCAVPIMLVFGKQPPINPTDITGKAVSIWLGMVGMVGLSAILGLILGRVRVSKYVNSCTKRSAFTSAHDWMNMRSLEDNRYIAVGTEKGVYRGSVAYLDNYDEGGSVVLFPDSRKKSSDTDTFDHVEATALLIPGSQILWLAQLNQDKETTKMDDQKLPTPNPGKWGREKRGREFPKSKPLPKRQDHGREHPQPKPTKK